LLSETNQIFSFGNNDFGQLGDSGIAPANVPIEIFNDYKFKNDENITNIFAGNDFSIFYTSYKHLKSFGNNKNGQSCTTLSKDNFLLSYDIYDIKSVSIGLGLEFAIHCIVRNTTSQVYSFGRFNDRGELGNGNGFGSNFPYQINQNNICMKKIIMVESGECKFNFFFF
jgi:alpha-tubulin suppressor-like RCC1 family protein